MTDSDDPAAAQPKSRIKAKAEGRAVRAARLAERLRANLGRRKQQARGRDRPEPGDGPDEPEAQS